MEFKKKLLKKNKARQARNRKARGLVRVKIRGRKRWVTGPNAAKNEES